MEHQNRVLRLCYGKASAHFICEVTRNRDLSALIFYLGPYGRRIRIRIMLIDRICTASSISPYDTYYPILTVYEHTE
jgi:hypothetical protein